MVCDNAIVRVDNCTITSQDGSGVYVKGPGTAVSLTNSTLRGSYQCGAVVTDHATLSMHKCTLHSNQLDGVTATDGATIMLTENVLRANGQHAVRVQSGLDSQGGLAARGVVCMNSLQLYKRHDPQFKAICVPNDPITNQGLQIYGNLEAEPIEP